jgi:DoxX-like family
MKAEFPWSKMIGVLALLVPMVPARLKEWAYAGFAINLISALIAHLSIRERPTAFAPSSIIGRQAYGGYPVSNDEAARRTGSDSTLYFQLPREH